MVAQQLLGAGLCFAPRYTLSWGVGEGESESTRLIAKLIEAEEALWGQERIVSSVLEAVSRASGSSFSAPTCLPP